MNKDFLHQNLERYWGFGVLILWGGALLTLGLMRFEPVGLDEGSARALLLNWSIMDKIANPIVTQGMPDMRAILFAPLGLYWSGSIFAAKVFTILMAFGAITLLFRWARQLYHPEGAMIAAALLLISPVMLSHMDAMGVGPYLLLAFGVGNWLDRRYRMATRPLGGWFYAQLLWVGATITLHPAALAYPLTLLWSWHKSTAAPQKRFVLVGVIAVTTLVLAARMGWDTVSFLGNPLVTLADIARGGHLPDEEPSTWLGGLIPLVLLVLVLVAEKNRLKQDFMGTMLLVALVIGALAADMAWGMIALSLLLFAGVPRLIALNDRLGSGLWGQRGVVMAVVVIVSTLSMMADRGYARLLASGVLSPQDYLIDLLAQQAADAEQPFKAASQWPARTMIACKRDVFPLPPADYPDGETLLKEAKGITHFLFDPSDPANASLARNIAQLGGATKAIVVQTHGVIIKVRDQAEDTAADQGPPDA